MNERSKLKDSILSLLPEALGRDLKDNVEATIQGYFEEMNLVSRKEFEVQQKVLAKTRTKLEVLEQTIEALEKQQK